MVHYNKISGILRFIISVQQRLCHFLGNKLLTTCEEMTQRPVQVVPSHLLLCLYKQLFLLKCVINY